MRTAVALGGRHVCVHRGQGFEHKLWLCEKQTCELFEVEEEDDLDDNEYVCLR